jgi:hypothetical protein
VSAVSTYWYLAWLILAPVSAVFLAAIVGASPTRVRVGPDGLVAMSVACGLSVLATILGSIPVAWAALRSPKHIQAFGYGGSLFRLVILTLLAVPTLVLMDLHIRTFLLWLGVSYVVALGAEVVFLVLLIRKMEAPN